MEFYIKRDETTIQSVESIYCYVAALPLPPQDRVELIRLADAAVTNAEKNGYLVGENEANTSVITKYMEQFLLLKMKQADSDTQP